MDAIPAGLVLAAKDITPTLLLLGGLIITVVVMGLIVVWIRGRMLAKDGPQNQEGLLSGLRSMRDRGEITPEEYDAARLSMAAKMAGVSRPQAGAGKTPAKGPPGGPPAGKPLASPGARVAKPGFDLTGAPLPRSGPPKSPPHSGQ